MAGEILPTPASLQLTLALLAVVITPVILAMFYARFELVTERVTLFQVARQVAQVTFLPVIIGLSLQQFAPRLAKVLRKPVPVLANILFILLLLMLILLLALVPELRAMLNVGGLPMVAILLMVVGSLTIGHLLGGPRRDRVLLLPPPAFAQCRTRPVYRRIK